MAILSFVPMAYLCLVLALIDLDVDTFDWIDWPESPECSAKKEDIAKSASPSLPSTVLIFVDVQT